MLTPPIYTVVLTPFGATKSGLFLFSPSVNAPPLDENDDTVGVFTPNAGVLVYSTEATAIAPFALACPTQLEVP